MAERNYGGDPLRPGVQRSRRSGRELDHVRPLGHGSDLAFCSGAEDVNGDGLVDITCHFHTESTGFLPGDTQGVLEGRTLLGAAIKGVDSVRIVR